MYADLELLKTQILLQAQSESEDYRRGFIDAANYLLSAFQVYKEDHEIRQTPNEERQPEHPIVGDNASPGTSTPSEGL